MMRIYHLFVDLLLVDLMVVDLLCWEFTICGFIVWINFFLEHKWKVVTVKNKFFFFGGGGE